jgi:hypothetical protein
LYLKALVEAPNIKKESPSLTVFSVQRIGGFLGLCAQVRSFGVSGLGSPSASGLPAAVSKDAREMIGCLQE